MAATGYTRQALANIQPNLNINSEDLNAEFNVLAQAFDNTSGHDHTGSVVGDGQKIVLTTAVSGVLPTANGGTGSASVTGTGLGVLQTSPTIITPALTGPLTIGTGALTVSTGGITVSAGGITVTGASTITGTTSFVGNSSITGNITASGTAGATGGVFDNSNRVFSASNKFGIYSNTFPNTTTTSGSLIMLGYNITFTPSISTRVLVCFAGIMGNNTSTDGVQVAGRYGTGTPPLNNAAVTGTAIGVTQSFTAAANNQTTGFTILGIISGLTLNTTYWFDLAMSIILAGTANANSVQVIITEI